MTRLAPLACAALLTALLATPPAAAVDPLACVTLPSGIQACALHAEAAKTIFLQGTADASVEWTAQAQLLNNGVSTYEPSQGERSNPYLFSALTVGLCVRAALFADGVLVYETGYVC